MENNGWLTRTSSQQSFRIMSKKQSGPWPGFAPSIMKTPRRFSAPWIA
jgi:hypothetical protein